MSETGLAAVWHDEGNRWDIREVPQPDVAPDGISVRVTATSICGADLHTWRSNRLSPESAPRQPFVFGHEMTGVVAALGSQIKTDSLRRPLKEGDRVVYAYNFPCMECYSCQHGEPFECVRLLRTQMSNGTRSNNGGFGQYYYLHGLKYVFKLPDEIDDNVAVSANCALVQVMEAFHIGRIKFGDDVVVQGAGGLGIYATAYAHYMGANRLIVVDGQPRRLELARQCGATEVVDMREYTTPDSRVERVMQLTGGTGGDIVIDLVGTMEAVEEGVQMCRARGTYLEVSHISPNPSVDFDAQRLMQEDRVMFANVHHYDPMTVRRAINFVMRTRHQYPLNKVISHTFPLEQVDRAFRTAEWLGRDNGSEVTRAVVMP